MSKRDEKKHTFWGLMKGTGGWSVVEVAMTRAAMEKLLVDANEPDDLGIQLGQISERIYQSVLEAIEAPGQTHPCPKCDGTGSLSADRTTEPWCGLCSGTGAVPVTCGALPEPVAAAE